MKKTSVLLALSLVAAGASAQDIRFKGTLDEAFAKAKADNKLVLLDFNSYT